MSQPSIEQRCADFRKAFESLRAEVGKVIVGQKDIIEGVLISLFCGGHVLLEGVPGLGKTLLVRTLSAALSLTFRRIQFTPDLMPADIIGTNVVTEDAAAGKPAVKRFQFQQGPIFAQMVLADEINRATPKTQSAMLEAMQEHCVTVAGVTYKLPEPFMVLSTQNPIELEGTYPLPEAQLDRFLMKLVVPYNSREELSQILDRTTTGQTPQVQSIMDGREIIGYQELVPQVVIAPHVQDYAIRLVMATHGRGEFACEMTNRFVRFGSSPRGVQALVLAAKVRAMLQERYHVAFEDLAQSYLPALRHRVLLNFEGQAEGISSDDVLKQILEVTPKTPE